MWLASCPFACGEEEEEGLSDSVQEDEGESEGEGGLTIVTGSGGRASPFCAGRHPAHEHRREAALICQNAYNGLLPHGQANLVWDVLDTRVGGVGSTWVEFQ